MIKMWDEMFSVQDGTIASALESGNGSQAFTRMHVILNQVWAECDRVLKNSGFICINIGDATRTIGGEFQLYSNHTKIINQFLNMGYSVLPDIHWRKPSNAPNKFMGSGMYPAGAYVTYEHEYILIFRKGGKRVFKNEEKNLRRKSAFFWEERNVWFSDLWELKGAKQSIPEYETTRSRSGAFPLEIPYRLVNMYSVEGDTILDPFAGLGTTSSACMIAERNSIGVDIDPEIVKIARQNLMVPSDLLNSVVENRIKTHLDFINSLPQEKADKCYTNIPHGFKVKTRQETELQLDRITSISSTPDGCECLYKKYDIGSRPPQLALAL